MKKFTGLAVGLFSILSWANPMCVELCTPCADKIEDASCVKADALCGCAAVLDSVAKAQEIEAAAKAEAEAAEAAAIEARNEAISNGKRQLTLNLLEDCGNSVCEQMLYFENDVFTKGEIANARNASDLSASDTADTTENDSTNAQDRLSKLDGAENLAGLAAGMCLGDSSECIVKVSYESKSMKLVAIQKVEKPKAEAKAVIAPAPKKTKLVVKPKPEPKSNSAYTPKPAPKEKRQHFYKGFGLTFGSYDENDFLDYSVDGENSIEDGNFEAGLSFIAKWYFYRAGSFQTGLNAYFRHHSYDEDDWKFIGYSYYYDYSYYLDMEAEYYNITLELPLAIRIGFPIKYFAPFISETFAVRKPIYGWAIYGWAQVYTYDYYHEEDTGGWKSDFYGAEDWEFVDWIGIGFEIAQHFAIEYQMIAAAFRTGNAHLYDDTKESFRVNMQFTW